MTRAPRTTAIIVAAGTGERAGGGVPKQYRHVAGKALIKHCVAAFHSHPAVDRILLVIGAGQEARLAEALPDEELPETVIGGATRRESVRRALDHLAAHAPPDRVMIHDAARPFLPPAVIDRLTTALDENPGATPYIPVVDTLARHEGRLGDTVDRSNLARIQTPQAFDFAALLAAHRAWPEGSEATDDAQILRAAGGTVAMIAGDTMLEKLTHPQDFALAEARFGQRTIRTGTGYDVHRLVEGEALWLGGVKIPHNRGLSGHSDADVGIHALVDAILGALAEGDIGSHFPPSDPQWRGAPSSRFLEFARDRVAARSGNILHTDLTLICEAPKIGPHRETIRARLAELMQIPLGKVSVKATTTERLGFTGRGEGIAAQAVATLSLPEFQA